MICQLDSCSLLPRVPFLSTTISSDSVTNTNIDIDDTDNDIKIDVNKDTPVLAPIPIIIIKKIDIDNSQYLYLKINPDETFAKSQLDIVKEIFEMLEGKEMIKIELMEYFKNTFSEELFEDMLNNMVEDYQHGLLFGILRSFYNLYNESSYSLVMDYEYTPHYEEIFSIAIK
jgi:hypothetical protein